MRQGHALLQGCGDEAQGHIAQAPPQQTRRLGDANLCRGICAIYFSCHMANARAIGELTLAIIVGAEVSPVKKAVCKVVENFSTERNLQVAAQQRWGVRKTFCGGGEQLVCGHMSSLSGFNVSERECSSAGNKSGRLQNQLVPQRFL